VCMCVCVCVCVCAWGGGDPGGCDWGWGCWELVAHGARPISGVLVVTATVTVCAGESWCCNMHRRSIDVGVEVLAGTWWVNQGTCGAEMAH
jgi:hypothetical protein